MGFVTPALLGGAALIALPIVLHLVMRREAQRLRFPALRFVQQRRSLNQHRLRLRHLLLLALRCAVIALLAFALARPTLRGSGAAGKEGAPMASVLVFDNSLRMEYQQANESRLARAKELALWLLEQLPADNPVTVVDRAGRQRGQDLERSAAELRVERLELSSAVRSMGDTLDDAARWLEGKPEHRGELYVFTDLATEAWPAETRAAFAQRVDQLHGANVYLIDVGVDAPRNLGLGPLRLSNEQITPGSMLQIRTELLSSSVPNGGGENTQSTTSDVVVELFVGSDAAHAEKRGQQTVELNRKWSEQAGDGRAVPIEFSVSGLELGTHQGFVRIAGSDGLPADDIRYFTVDVRPPRRVLLLSENPDDALFLREALSPSTAVGLAQPKFECEVHRYNQWSEVTLSDFAAVCLVDPPALADETWNALVDYAENGGGVGVFLGRRAKRNEMNQPAPQRLMPAKLRWTSHEATFLRPVAVEHPALADLRDLADVVPWSEFPVFKYWELEAGAESSHVIATFANGKPALVERQIGSGRVLIMTTSVSDPAYDDPWNLLPTGADPWPFLALASGIADYLSGLGETSLNYLAGQTVVLRLLPEENVTSYVLQLPDASGVRQSLTPGQPDLSIASTEMLGNYRVRAGGREGQLDRGFSVNLPAEVTRLERVPPVELVESLGKDRARVARTQEEIELRVGVGRVGRELFPALIIALALGLAAEQLLANRFYSTAGAAGRAAPSDFGTQRVPGISDRGLQSETAARSNPQSEFRIPKLEPVRAGSADLRP
jgi:hypothetical protein